MTENEESIFARHVHSHAFMFGQLEQEPEDRQAATMAILVQALILSTQDLSAERRAGLFLTKESE